jgi:hypothetical protein
MPRNLIWCAAAACGYVSTKKDGAERLNFTAFYEALLEAKSLSLGNDGISRASKLVANLASPPPRKETATY